MFHCCILFLNPDFNVAEYCVLSQPALSPQAALQQQQCLLDAPEVAAREAAEPPASARLPARASLPCLHCPASSRTLAGLRASTSPSLLDVDKGWL